METDVKADIEHAKALLTIPHVPLPATDPVHGEGGPVARLWRTQT